MVLILDIIRDKFKVLSKIQMDKDVMLNVLNVILKSIGRVAFRM